MPLTMLLSRAVEVSLLLTIYDEAMEFTRHRCSTAKLTSEITVSEPGQVAESFDSKLTEHMYQVLKDEGQLDEGGALEKL
jgi:hypothetical protein